MKHISYVPKSVSYTVLELNLPFPTVASVLLVEVGISHVLRSQSIFFTNLSGEALGLGHGLAGLVTALMESWVV